MNVCIGSVYILYVYECKGSVYRTLHIHCHIPGNVHTGNN